MTHASLFSGIGGFDLAAEWMGWENIFHCEWNPFGQKVLKHHFPNSKSYEDITKTDFSIHRGTIDILTGGFPCQPYSSAGKRLGKEDERHLCRKCLEQLKKFNHVSLWAKTFADLLIGMEGWYSMRCNLTWKLKATKSSRFYCQLVPLMHPTAETEFGLLPTVTTRSDSGRSVTIVDGKIKNQSHTTGTTYGITLGQLMRENLLPTPTRSDYQPRWKTENWKGDSDLPSVMNEICGTRSQLNPLFVEEMMGFPENWTLLPFLNGEMSQSKHTETQ